MNTVGANDMLTRVRSAKKLPELLKTINGKLGYPAEVGTMYGDTEDVMYEVAYSDGLTGKVYRIDVDYDPTYLILGFIRTAEKAIRALGGTLLDVSHFDPIDRMGEWDEDGRTTISYYVIL